ncbi:MAG: T9SS type A sorting domain-containing protein, partial [Saprospiraceae bacterium]|nr:T9SS type A sorting domain-containing protein [Saprospiraceae bacterium]
NTVFVNNSLPFWNNWPPFSNPNNLPVTQIDLPAIEDIDCDGDLDILTFDIGGGLIDLYQNMSLEDGFGLDSLRFLLADDCWGGVYESGFAPEVDLADGPDDCASNFDDDNPDTQDRHAGSTVMAYDMDNDGDKDVFLGDLSFSNIVYLHNAGSCNNAYVDSQDANYPSQGFTVDIPTFPASYFVDVDQDGVKDFIAAANRPNNSVDYEVSWFYKNTGTNEVPQLVFQQKDFLVGEMLDFGSGGRPAFIDYNADGLMDLVIGNYGFYQTNTGNRISSLYLFENVGTPTAPAYELVDDDYLDMAAFSPSSYSYFPTFGDLDNDGDEDLLIGDFFGKLFYVENSGGAGNPVSFGTPQYGYMGIDIGQESIPEIGDINNDGLPDLLIGERNGNVNFFANTGTATAPFFDSDFSAPGNNQFCCGLDARVPGNGDTGQAAPKLVNVNDEWLLLMGTNFGRIELYEDIIGSVNSSAVLIDSVFEHIDVGASTTVDLADIDGDGLYEIAVSNFRGGLGIFNTSLEADEVLSNEGVEVDNGLHVFPNPTIDQLVVQLKNARQMELTLFDASGKLILRKQGQDDKEVLQLKALSTGIYYLQVRSEQGVWTEKIIRQ